MYLIDTPRVWRDRKRIYARLPETTDPITGSETVFTPEPSLHGTLRSAAKAKAAGPAIRELVVQLLQARGEPEARSAETRRRLAKISEDPALPLDPDYSVREGLRLVRETSDVFAKEAKDKNFPAAL